MAEFELADGVRIIDLFLYIEEFDTLVIGDTHFGYESDLARKGVLLPKFQTREILEKVEEALEEVKPEKVIVVGDLKHEFGRISKEEWRDTLKFIDLVQEHGEVILIKGNHDTILEPIAEKRNVEVYDHYSLGEYYFCHGHEVPEDLEFQGAPMVIIGHEHPAIGLRDGVRVETYKCFLKGPYKDKEIVVLPSISSLPEGTDVLKEQVQSPFLEELREFEAYVVENEVFEFGKLKDLMDQE